MARRTRVDRRQALVDVVQQLRLRRQAGAHGGEHAGHAAQLLGRVEERGPAATGVGEGARGGAATPGLHSLVAAELAADVAEATLPERLRLLQHLPRIVAVGMHVDGGGTAAATAPELVAGHAGRLALDVPQRHLHRAHGVVQHRAVAPVAVVHGAVPEVGDGAGVAADGERLQVPLDGRLHRPEALGEGAAAPAVQTRLIGDHLGHHQRNAPRLHGPGHDVDDTHASDTSPATLPDLPRRPTAFPRPHRRMERASSSSVRRFAGALLDVTRHRGHNPATALRRR